MSHSKVGTWRAKHPWDLKTMIFPQLRFLSKEFLSLPQGAKKSQWWKPEKKQQLEISHEQKNSQK